jgi:hypothetical protein
MSGLTKNPSRVNAQDASRMATDSQMAILFAREGIVDWTPVGNGQFPA